MTESLLVSPSIPFASAQSRGEGWLVSAIAAPGRWLDARRVRAELAALSEREWHDIGAGARDLGRGYPRSEDAAERAARQVALQAWSAPRHVSRPQASAA